MLGEVVFMSDGTPPPPPPPGGGSQGGQQPYGQPYGSQPPGQPYGSPPPPGEPYGQQPNQPPAYGAPPPDPYAQPPQYGAPPPPAYGAPQYGAPPAYGQPAAPYGQPYGAAPAYGAPPPAPGNLASMGKRFGARVIDGLISIVVIGVLGAVIIGSAFSQTTVDENGNITSGAGFFGGAFFGYAALVLVYGVAYEVVLIALKGATLGKMALGIKVVREADGGVPGWGPSVLRWVIPQVAGLVCGLITLAVYLSPFWDNTGRMQGWHDKVAKTLVVNK